MEIFGLSFGSWSLLVCLFAVVSFIGELIAIWLSPKILRWYRRKKGGDVDG